MPDDLATFSPKPLKNPKRVQAGLNSAAPKPGKLTMTERAKVGSARLTPAERSERARHAAQLRWSKTTRLLPEHKRKSIEGYVRRVVNSAPQLTDEQRRRLAAICAPAFLASRKEVAG